MNRPWTLRRRAFLRGVGLKGVGVSLALPFFNCMGADIPASTRPRRFCAIYFPYGVSMADKTDKVSKWRWFPSGQGRDFQFHESLKSLEPFRNELSVLGGLSHPNGRSMGGHDTADIWLTGAQLQGRQLRNTVSLDQIAAGNVDGGR